MKFSKLAVYALLFLSLPAFSSSNSLQEVLELHRKIIFLIEDGAKNNISRERDVFIARNFYVEKRHLLENIEDKVLSGSKESKAVTQDFISFLQQDSTRAADALAFIDVIDVITYQHDQKPFLTTGQKSYFKDLERKISLIQSTYQDNINAINAQLKTRGLTLEPWEDYIAFLKKQYDRKTIYQEFNKKESELAEPASRGSESKKDKAELVWGYKIPDKTVVLTFDDGPHYKNTGKILDVLKEHDAHGYFFAVGRNIGNVKNNKVTQGKKAKILKRALKEGHRIANHSFSHSVLTKLDSKKQKQELNKTNELLKSVSGYENKDFRPPYGSKNKKLLSLSNDLGMRAVMWNIDSMDWADPVPDSIVNRVMEKLRKDKKGILLFHDIHKQTVQALPKLLKILKKEGYRVVTIDGKAFDDKQSNTVTTVDKKSSPQIKSGLYGESWALVVGINDYKYWPKLSYAKNDAKGVAKVLREKYGFKSDHIFELYNENATRENIEALLSDTLSDPAKVKPNDRVFVFYAGHGMTRSLPSGRNLGYIIPVNAELNRFSSTSISMTHLQDFSDMIPAKHLYFVMDSCYSGIALTRSGGLKTGSKYIKEISSRRARQILTAGGADQEVADGGPQGHSIFTWSLLQGLNGDADLDKNNIITASELGAYIAPRVSENSNQTPVFGNLVGNEGGDFLFELEPLNLSDQPLSEEEKLKQMLLALQKENEKLKQQIKNDKPTELKDEFEDLKILSPAERRERAVQLHRKGLKQYKKKNLEEALDSLKKALVYNPRDTGLVNDYGFILYRNGELEKSLEWLEKTIEMDADRIPVYLNIADTLAKLERPSEAIPYYQHYLSLYPKSPVKDRVDGYLEKHK